MAENTNIVTPNSLETTKETIEETVDFVDGENKTESVWKNNFIFKKNAKIVETSNPKQITISSVDETILNKLEELENKINKLSESFNTKLQSREIQMVQVKQKFLKVDTLAMKIENLEKKTAKFDTTHNTMRDNSTNAEFLENTICAKLGQSFEQLIDQKVSHLNLLCERLEQELHKLQKSKCSCRRQSTSRIELTKHWNAHITPALMLELEQAVKPISTESADLLDSNLSDENDSIVDHVAESAIEAVANPVVETTHVTLDQIEQIESGQSNIQPDIQSSGQNQQVNQPTEQSIVQSNAQINVLLSARFGR